MTRHRSLLVTPLVALVSLVACAPSGEAPVAERYTCPMHPSYVSDRPGSCPICGMQLVPVATLEARPPDGGPPPPVAAAAPPAAMSAAQASSAAPSTGSRRPLFYRSPMNPSDTSPVPKKDAMGMDYVPVYPEEPTAVPTTPGRSTVTIDAERRRLLGLKTTPVVRATIGGELRTVGRVALDEERVVKVQPRFEGFVERLEADFTGKYVKKGQRLASIYSPELHATEQELLLAARGQQALAAMGLGDAVDAARARLRLLGIDDAQIDAVLRTGRPHRALDLVAPISGYVTVKNAVAGARVTLDSPLFEIVDLSTVWVLADVYESDLPRVAVGQAATVTLAYWPDRAWRGKVSWIYPIVDDKTRTVKVRVAVPNPKTELRPEMFADVVLAGRAREALVVPDDALIDTGTRKVAFVDAGGGRLVPREVTTGEHARGLTEVRAGLAEGEQVATGAAFLLDSESRLRSAAPTETARPHVHAADGGAPGERP